MSKEKHADLFYEIKDNAIEYAPDEEYMEEDPDLQESCQ